MLKTLRDVGEGQVKRLAGTGPRFPRRVKNAGSARSALLPLYPPKADIHRGKRFAVPNSRMWKLEIGKRQAALDTAGFDDLPKRCIVVRGAMCSPALEPGGGHGYAAPQMRDAPNRLPPMRNALRVGGKKKWPPTVRCRTIFPASVFST